MSEQWKDIKGYKGLYEVSDLGRVKNARNGRIRKTPLNKRGYSQLILSKDNKKRNFTVHQLVAMGFLGHVPNGNSGLVVDHIDNNPSNNRADNLQLITNRENTSKDRKGGYSKYVGVSWNKRCSKWISSIYHSGSMHHLGYYTDEEEARDVYVQALARIQGGLPPKSVLVKNQLR